MTDGIAAMRTGCIMQWLYHTGCFTYCLAYWLYHTLAVQHMQWLYHRFILESYLTHHLSVSLARSLSPDVSQNIQGVLLRELDLSEREVYIDIVYI